MEKPNINPDTGEVRWRLEPSAEGTPGGETSGRRHDPTHSYFADATSSSKKIGVISASPLRKFGVACKP